MTAGRLRHRVTLQRLSPGADGFGGLHETWQDVATVWASVEPLRGGERYRAQQIQAGVTHQVTMRYRPGVTPQMRLRFAGRTLSIHAVLDPEERRIQLELLCAEVI